MSVETISLTKIQQLLADGRPLCLIDVRAPAEFSGVHAIGAKLMPLDDLDIAAIAAGRQKADEPIYVICQSGGRSAKACQLLQAAGVTPVFSVEGGTAAWEKMGLPVVRGQKRVISMERQVRIGAGTLVLLGLALARWVHPVLVVVPIFVGGGLVFAGVTDYCGMAIVLSKMPWNGKTG